MCPITCPGKIASQNSSEVSLSLERPASQMDNIQCSQGSRALRSHLSLVGMWKAPQVTLEGAGALPHRLNYDLLNNMVILILGTYSPLI